jgi:8-oxo-(d)GTP phosphatase
MPDQQPTGSEQRAEGTERQESRLIRAAGAVAWRPGAADGEPEVLLVHRPKYGDWSLPKGKTEPGEQLPVTAVREVAEESGARLVLGRRLTSVRYQSGGRPKRVHFWAARVSGVDEAAVPNTEVDQVAWLPVSQARERASYAFDVRVLDDFAGQRADTVSLILLRHAKALPRSEWKGDDAERPLDDAGRADAKTLPSLLACFAPLARVLSSVAVRCLDTVRPYAALTGTQVRAERSLYVQSSGTGPADSAALITETIRAGEPAVCCAHRENMPVLQAAAVGALGGPDSGRMPEEWGNMLPTSGFWVLHMALPPPPSAAGPQRPRRVRWLPAGRPVRNTGPALVAADRYDLSDV